MPESPAGPELMRRAESMDGRHPEAVRLTLTTCTDRTHEAGFNTWYDRVHLPDILGGGVATHATRFADADPESANPAYLALYELSGLDLEQIHRRFADLVQRLQRDGRMLGDLQIVRRSMWRRLGGKFTTDRTGRVRTTGLFIIESSCSAPDRERDFNEWYERIHIPDLLGTGLFHTAHRFQTMAGQSGGKYLAIYETDGDPLDAVNEFSRSHRPQLKAAGRLSEIIDITWRGIYRRLIQT